MRKSTTRSLAWWLDHLDGVTQVGDGYKALCPSHDDLEASLSITKTPDGEILVHCFAGCDYKDILDSLNGNVVTPKVKIKRRPQIQAPEVKQWWEEYTGIPIGAWELWGTEFSEKEVIFKWSDLPVRKIRKAGGKEFSWRPIGTPAPPLWPYPEEVLPSRVYLCEGETDTGVLLAINLPAYAMTKGAQTPMTGALATLRSRGVKEVVAVLDADTSGETGVEKLTIECISAGIQLLEFPTSALVNPLLGEKDLRDYWIRVKDPDKVLHEVLRLTPEPISHPLSYVSLDEFLSTPIPDEDWLSEDIWLSGTIGVIAGAPKMYKSWLALDLGLSIASGTDFLGTFSIPDPGPVVFVPKEDPNFLLQDRCSKILSSKGLGGFLTSNHIQFPEMGLPFYLDLTRDFLFTGEGSAGLFDYLDQIAFKHGRIRAVFFDPILRMLLGIDEYKASEVSETVFAIASEIQKRYQSAVILVHHRSKGGADVGKRSYGSIAFHAFSESSIYLKGEEPDTEGWVEAQGEFKSSQPTYWAYRFPELQPKYNVEVRRKAETQDLRTTILETLNKINEGLTADELTQNLAFASDGLIRKTLKQLQEDGEVKSIIEKDPKGGPGRRRWVLND